MKKIDIITILLFIVTFNTSAQVVRFDRSNAAKVGNSAVDTLLYPFTGGLNAPQFSNIDLDGDGKQDLFVFDRIGDRVFCFLRKNNRWEHAPQFEVQFPKLYKWALLKDYNCDGKPDIFTEVDFNAQPDPGKFISSNGLRVLLNVSTQPGELKWRQDKNQIMDLGVDQLPPSNLGISNADINSFDDVDGDGDLDMLLMPFGKNVITYYQNLSKERGFNCDSLLFQFRDECWGYASYKVNTNGFVLADNSPCYRYYKKARKHNGTTLAMYDADADGDMDLLYGDVGFNEIVFLRNGRTLNSNNRDSIIEQDTLFPSALSRASVQTFPATFVVDINDDGKRDLLVAPNADAGAKNRNMVLAYHNTSPNATYQFTFQRSDFLVGQMLDLGGGAFPQLVDLDKDGDKDLVIATQGDFQFTQNSWDRLVYYENIGDSLKALFQLKDTNFLKINDGAEKLQRMAPSFGDLNNDGKADLLIGDLNGKLHYYENTSTGGVISFNKVSGNLFNMYGGTFATPQLIDLNKDGKTDLVMGRKNGTLAYFENTGTPGSAQFSESPTIDSIGKLTVAEMVISQGQPYYFDGYAAPHVCDLDKDGNYEVLVGANSGRVHLFRNFEASATRKCDEITNLFSNHSSQTPTNLVFGPRSIPFTADITGDGVAEFMVGNNRGGIELYKTTINGVISSVKTISRQELTFTVYPNPSNGKFKFSAAKNLKDGKYEVYDVRGLLQTQGKLSGYEQEIELNLPTGIYLFSVVDVDGNLSIQKILIQ